MFASSAAHAQLGVNKTFKWQSLCVNLCTPPLVPENNMQMCVRPAYVLCIMYTRTQISDITASSGSGCISEECFFRYVVVCVCVCLLVCLGLGFFIRMCHTYCILYTLNTLATKLVIQFYFCWCVSAMRAP